MIRANVSKNVPIRRSSSNVMYLINITSLNFEEGKRFLLPLKRGSNRHRVVTPHLL